MSTITDERWPQISRSFKHRLRRGLLSVIVVIGLLFVPTVVLVRRMLKPPEVPAAEPKTQEGTVVLQEAARRAAGVLVEAARTITRTNQLDAPGVLILDETRTARIGAMIEGKILTVSAEVGDRVRAGARLAEIDSRDLHVAWAEYRKALAERKQRKTELNYARQADERMRRLYATKAISRQEQERAQTDRVVAEQALAMAELEVHRTKEFLEHLGVSSTETPHNESGVRLPVKTPLAGAILEKYVTAGTTVTSGMPLFIVSDLSSLWAQADIDETALSRVKVGLPVTVHVGAYPDETFAGTIIFIGDTLDPKTRRVSVRCQVPNPHGRLKPQMYATLSLGESTPQFVTIVPSQAVQDIDGKSVVFVENEKGSFTRREVETGAETDGWVEVHSGVQAGEKVATAGSFLLKSELLKASMTEEE